MAEPTVTAAPIQIVISGAQGPNAGSGLPVLTGTANPNFSEGAIAAWTEYIPGGYGTPVNGDTLTVVGEVYTFRTTASADHDIQLNATASVQAANIRSTVNGTDGRSDANESVTAAQGTTNLRIIFTAIEAGDVGNDFTVIAQNDDVLEFANGVQGTTLTAAGLGQQYRQGSSSPYVWWKWDGTTWVLDASGGYIQPQEIYVSLRTDGQPGTGSVTDPFDWTDPDVSLAWLQEQSTLKRPTTLYVADGRYPLHPGRSGGVTAWQIWSHLSIVGAGKGRTVFVPTLNVAGQNFLFGTNFSIADASAPGGAFASEGERIVRGTFTDFSIDGEMSPGIYTDRTWNAFVMDGDLIDIRNVEVARIGGGAAESFPILIFHTPTDDASTRKCGITIDNVEVIDCPFYVIAYATGIMIAGGNTASLGAGHSLRNKFAVVSNFKVINSGCVGVSQMRNVYWVNGYVDPKGVLPCVNIDTGPVTNIQFVNSTFVNAQDQYRDVASAHIGGADGSVKYDVSFHNCYHHVNINGFYQGAIKLQGGANVRMLGCTIEPSTIDDTQDGTVGPYWVGAVFAGINNKLYCDGNKMYDGRDLPAILCDTPPPVQALPAWDAAGIMLNKPLILPLTTEEGGPTSATLRHQRMILKGPGSFGTIVAGVPQAPTEGTIRVFSVPEDTSIVNFEVRTNETLALIGAHVMAGGDEISYCFLNDEWLRIDIDPTSESMVLDLDLSEGSSWITSLGLKYQRVVFAGPGDYGTIEVGVHPAPPEGTIRVFSVPSDTSIAELRIVYNVPAVLVAVHALAPGTEVAYIYLNGAWVRYDSDVTSASGNIDGGTPSSIYGGTEPIEGGTP